MGEPAAPCHWELLPPPHIDMGPCPSGLLGATHWVAHETPTAAPTRPPTIAPIIAPVPLLMSAPPNAAPNPPVNAATATVIITTVTI